MNRIDFIKADKWRIIVLLLLTAWLPFLVDAHNPAGAQPIIVFGGLALMGWIGFIGMLLLPAKDRAEFIEDMHGKG